MADTPPRRGSAPQFTITEAVQWLDPPIDRKRLADLLRCAGVKSTGVRYTGGVGRPEKTYDAAEIMRLHSAILEWLLSAMLTILTIAYAPLAMLATGWALSRCRPSWRRWWDG